MKAFVHEGIKGIDGIRYRDIVDQDPSAYEVKVELRYAGLNHRDLFVLQRHPETAPPLIIGSDGAGIIAEIGSEVSGLRVGDEVVINPGLGWIEKTDAPPEGFDILGMPDHGTLAEKVVVPAANVEAKPKHLSWAEAGVLPLAALTAYRALFTQANVKPSDTILLPGVGSGAVTFLLLFAKAIGARVIVTSRSEEKRKRALQLGADFAIDSDSDWEEALKGETIDVVIETVGAATFHKSLNKLRKGGTIVTFGASAGDEITLSIRDFFYGQYKLLGTTMGSQVEFKEMLQFVTNHRIKPVIDQEFPLEQVDQALLRLDQAEQFGKIAIKM